GGPVSGLPRSLGFAGPAQPAVRLGDREPAAGRLEFGPVPPGGAKLLFRTDEYVGQRGVDRQRAERTLVFGSECLAVHALSLPRSAGLCRGPTGPVAAYTRRVYNACIDARSCRRVAR